MAGELMTRAAQKSGFARASSARFPAADRSVVRWVRELGAGAGSRRRLRLPRRRAGWLAAAGPGGGARCAPAGDTLQKPRDERSDQDQTGPSSQRAQSVLRDQPAERAADQPQLLFECSRLGRLQIPESCCGVQAVT